MVNQHVRIKSAVPNGGSLSTRKNTDYDSLFIF